MKKINQKEPQMKKLQMEKNLMLLSQIPKELKEHDGIAGLHCIGLTTQRSIDETYEFAKSVNPKVAKLLKQFTSDEKPT